METKGAKVLITGCNRGIGKHVAEVLAKNGAKLYLANRRPDPKQLQELENLGAQSVTNIQADLDNRADVEKLIADMQGEEIDILFNNAGLLTGGLIENLTTDEIYSSNQVNVTALMHLTQGLVGGMVKRGRGKIINHSSISAYMHMPCSSLYSAQKAAVLAFTNCLRPELKGTGVTTLCLLTPGVETDLKRDIMNRYGANLDAKLFKQGMQPEDYAERVHNAILNDVEVLKPSGMGLVEMNTAKYALGVFQKFVSMNFKR
jgi:short-subunit dehydrogenase